MPRGRPRKGDDAGDDTGVAERLIDQALSPDAIIMRDETFVARESEKKAYWSYRPLVEFAPDRDPWARQPRETSDAYAAFIIFRDSGPFGRSINGVARAINKTRTVPKRWHDQYRWDERAALWDDSNRREFDALRKDIQQKAVKDHAQVAFSLIGLCVALLNEQRRQGVPDGKSLQQAAVALNHGIRHHRLAIGLPTDITQNDQYLKTLLEEALTVQEHIRLLLEEHLCPTCRDSIGAELRSIAEKQRRIRDRAQL